MHETRFDWWYTAMATALVLAVSLLWACLEPPGLDAGEIGKPCHDDACPVWLRCRDNVRSVGSRTCELADCYIDGECADGQACRDLRCIPTTCGPAELTVLP